MTRPKVDPLEREAWKQAGKFLDEPDTDAEALVPYLIRFARLHGAAEYRRGVREAAEIVRDMVPAPLCGSKEKRGGLAAIGTILFHAHDRILALLKGGRT